ncbi:MAG TPA: response regulator transcription factor [Spirochaetales bacterium]|nr:response regulator transcription factor [Spirochaetales bacterium]HPM71432.1 response regulator transcription factor [Spirochaetales bacterium]
MSAISVLLIEDEPGLVLTLTDLLSAKGYAVTNAADLASAEAAVASGGHDVILLDLMLPGGSGLDLLKAMRSRGDATPLLVLTAKADVTDRVEGLRLGADDYLGKPFDSAELLARIEALVRRTKDGPARRRRTEAAVRFGDVEIDPERAEVRKAGIPVTLTVQEFRLLMFLVENEGRTLSRACLLEEVWGYDGAIASRTVDVHISSLRQKLGDEPSDSRRIVTIRGFGYRFDSNPQGEPRREPRREPR